MVPTFSLFVSLDSVPGGGEGTQMSSGMFYFKLELSLLVLMFIILSELHASVSSVT